MHSDFSLNNNNNAKRLWSGGYNISGSKGRFRPLKKFEKFGIFSKLSKLSKLPRSTMWKWTSTSRSVLVHFHIVESWKVWKTRPCCCNPGTQSSPDLQQRKTRIGQLNLCRMKLPYRQRQQERASRVRRDHKLALRTAFVALLLVTTSVVSAAATIQPPEVRRNLPSHASDFAGTITRTSPRGKGLFSGNIA